MYLQDHVRTGDRELSSEVAPASRVAVLGFGRSYARSDGS